MWKGNIISKNSGFLKSALRDGRIASLTWSEEGEQGVGGAAGMKKEGTAATVDWVLLTFVSSFTAQMVKGLAAYDDSDPQNHIWNIARLLSPKRIDQLSQSTAKRVSKRHNSGRRHPSMVRKP